MNNKETVYLHRFSPIRTQDHMDAYIGMFPEEVKLREKYGFKTLHINLSLGVMPCFSWIYTYSGDDVENAEKLLAADPEKVELDKLSAPHILQNVRKRPVELIYAEPKPSKEFIKGKQLVMRRYSIKPEGWDEHIKNMEGIIPLRTEYGFVPVFEVADREQNMFTWAFRFEGKWEDFTALQKPYYEDPRRVYFDVNNNNLTDIAIEPAIDVMY